MGGQLRPKISNHHLSQAANSAHRPGISSSPNGAQHLHGGVGARYPSSYTSSLGDHSRINYRVFNNPIFDDSKEPEDDDWLHNPDPVKDAKADHSIGGCSRRGFLNVSVLLLISVCCICLFAGYPIITHFVTIPASKKGGFGLGGTNGSGQVPFLPYIASLVDPDTSRDARAWKSPYSNDNYHLVFSDEFNVEGRTFWPGDDPYWTAIDLQYAATGDYEWYSPEAINTTGGNLVISLEEHELHNLNFRSGMLQSWNKFCFQGGYLEISAVLPGSHNSKSFWPGLWTMGNLGRPGFRGSSQGMWPYSYNSCDVGILPNQTYLDKSGPDKAIHAQGEFNKGDISYLEGMRMPSCTCDGEDHAGPNVKVGRSAPELDVLEAATYKGQGQASQSLQIAPFSTDYKSDQTKSALHRKTSFFNPYTGGVYQQSVSGVSNIPDDGYELTGNAFHTFGFEYEPDWKGDGSGWVTWYMDGSPTWTVTGAAIGPDSQVEIGQRLIPVEPMSIIINLAISDGFQQIDWTTMSFPAQLKVDYVRVYQRDGEKERISCDPPDHPTSDYIERHLDIYYNENYTIYPQEKYGWPKNKLTASC
ncbi:beta-glucan synthesis-associated [Violaceomyces palustris]|uniref:Beta-glucan synthesis-associated n=1 Tax=Violaceomyces palustris TaxID=1673888 RepID=A0ACD0NTX7_9BASI|nr:beta-glucan synthesis-associated [Violaceomyces palustris]